jgi:hypothetical protein
MSDMVVIFLIVKIKPWRRHMWPPQSGEVHRGEMEGGRHSRVDAAARSEEFLTGVLRAVSMATVRAGQWRSYSARSG